MLNMIHTFKIQKTAVILFSIFWFYSSVAGDSFDVLETKNNAGEQQAWEFIQDFATATDLEDFLGKYPNGKHAAAASKLMKQLSKNRPRTKKVMQEQPVDKVNKIKMTESAKKDMSMATEEKPAKMMIKEKKMVKEKTVPVIKKAKAKMAKPINALVSLTVSVTPKGAKIRIKNIGPKYVDGIRLKPGAYNLDIYKPGYQRIKRWVKITEDTVLNFSLEK